MKDTSLGQHQELVKSELSITAADMGDEEWNVLVAKRQKSINSRKAHPTDTLAVEEHLMGEINFAVLVFQRLVLLESK